MLSIFVVGGCSQAQPVSPHLNMGNPSRADASSTNNYLMRKSGFALSYNNTKGTPNWVSWRLTKSDLGHAGRVEFYPDERLPIWFKAVTPGDYTRSGFDRGHLCPHGDRSSGGLASRATFVMTNIIPQSPNLNRDAWNQLEIYCRKLVSHGKTLYIFSGPQGRGGVGSRGRKAKIGRETSVSVPSKCWKVIMVLNGGPGDDLKKVTRKTRLIAVIMPNDMSVGEEWGGYRVSVADVEKLTGYRFFDKVPAAIINPLKKKVDRLPIPPPVQMSRGG
jgi:endonuclease G